MMAQWLFRGVMDPDQVKHELYSTKIMSYREELRETYGESTSSGFGAGRQSGRSSGKGKGGTKTFPFDSSDR